MMRRLYFLVVLVFFYLTSFSNTYDAELVTQKTSIEVSGGTLTTDQYFEIKIHNRSGEKFTKIAIPHSKMVKLRNINAFIKDSSRKIVKELKKSDIVEKSSISDFSFYEDDFIKEFTLKHNTYPYTIVYSYQTIQSEFITIDHWIPVIHEKVPTTEASLTVSVPENYKIAYKNQFVEEPDIDTLKNTLKYQWKARYTDIIKSEQFAPPIFDFLPSVKIVPLKFNYDEKGSFENWVAYGNWENELLKGLDDVPADETQKILSLIKDVNDTKEKIRILYHYLQEETRYINVTIETGGLKPYPASYVAQNKYGDCKALSNYFKSVLDLAGIPSYYANVYADNPVAKIDINFPSQQFNHIILYIPLESEDIWLDCTSDGPFNYLGTFTQNREAFIIQEDNSHFIKTPPLEPSEVLEIRNIEVPYNQGDTKVKFSNTYRGDAYDDILLLENNYGDSEKSKIMRNYLIEDGFQLAEYKIHFPNRDSTKVNLSYNATSQNIYKHYGNDILLSNIPFVLPELEKPQTRKLPVQIDYPVHNVDTIVYEIPDGYKLNKDSITHTISTKYGVYKINTHKDGGAIITTKSLLIHPGYYPLSEYEEFYDFYTQIIEFENKTHVSFFK